MIRLKFFIIFIILGSLVTLGATCGSGSNVTLSPIKLKIWRVWDEEDAFKDIIKAYRTLHPNVEIEYRKLRYEEYRDELLSAWARGEGPDIFSVPNSWVGEYREFMSPLPASLAIPKIVTKTVMGCKKEKTKVIENTKTYTPETLQSAFIPSVVDDVVFYDDEKVAQIYGLPLATDNLALYYNRDMLDQANIPLPPKTWKELLTQIPKLVKENSKSELIQSGIALGTTENIQRYFDILSLLMIQDGTQMGSIDTSNKFRTTISEKITDAEGESFLPGSHALSFYTDFANPSKQAYSWNENLPNSFEAFTQGQLAYFLGYAYHLPLIKEAAPRLNFDVSTVPQVSLNQEVNYANYWVESVYNNSENINWAWDFIYFATHKDNVTSYLDATNTPSALREIIKLQSEQNPEIDVFVNQALTSRSWYHGRSYSKVEEIFTNMIADVLANTSTPKEIVESAEKTINQNEQLKE